MAALVSEGLTDVQIAKRLLISERAAQGHLQQIRYKLNLDTRAQIVSWFGRQTADSSSAVQSVRTNLPVLLTSFVGRETELSELRRLLKTTRLLTVTGVGGAGKTRIAIEAAAQSLADYPDGVWFVDLSSLTDPAVMPQTIATLLGIREQERSDLVDTIGSELAAARCQLKCLLILDNCEHLVAQCAAVAERLLKACPQLAILCTSREPLQVAGEVTWHLPPLSLPGMDQAYVRGLLVRADAVELFLDRAAMADPGFELTESNAALITEICRRLDGIPLALELAAARVGVLSVDALLRHLDDRFVLSRPRAYVPRQQTLEATIGWSYQLLTEDERRAFRQLGVFSGGFSVEAAAAVSGGTSERRDQALEMLVVLTEKSLVQRVLARRDRYALLDTIRRYAHQRLEESGELETVRQRHFDHFLEFVERASRRLTGPEQAAWLDRLSDDYDNIRAALEFSQSQSVAKRLQFVLALAGFWFIRGQLREGRAWLHDVLSVASGVSSARAETLNAAFRLAWRQGDYVQARDYLIASVSIWRELDNRRGLQPCLTNLGVIAASEGDFQAARSYFEESLELAQEFNDARAIGLLHDNLGLLAAELGDTQAAVAHLTEGLTILRQIGDPARIANSLVNLGTVALSQGRVDDAAEHYAESLQILRDLGDVPTLADCLEGFACLASTRGDAESALRLAGAAAAMRGAAESPPAPMARRLVESLLAEARQTLKADAARCWEEGAALTRSEAIALAFQQRPGSDLAS